MRRLTQTVPESSRAVATGRVTQIKCYKRTLGGNTSAPGVGWRVRGEGWWVTHHPLGAPWPHKTDEEFANKDQLSPTVSALSLLIFDRLLCFTPHPSLPPNHPTPHHCLTLRGTDLADSGVLILIPAEPLKCLTICRLSRIYNYHHITFKLDADTLLHNLTSIYQWQ